MGVFTTAKQRLVSVTRVLARRLTAETTDFDPAFFPLAAQVRGFTMTSQLRQYALFRAAKFVTAKRIEGAFVECGVWRGGSSLLAALTFKHLGDQSRDLWLYDTFAGMTAPTVFDAKPGKTPESTVVNFKAQQKDDHNAWCYASLEDVKGCLARADYPADKLHYVVGDVTSTLPGNLPGKIAILRLDTDFYDSTKAELEHLYALLKPGGILILDDYGGWDGARKAVDEFLAAQPTPVFLARVDETARIAQKPYPAAA
ncbi:TylF/MycF/NovP-related O-methyltransferase [Parablastomonas sp. CN1-191]|uniref:TylF/MycF/NovP-related O-methyltransferase n=1 Tax=Parablastomonas sp. CN1-191 TaxID=3400908 RepID=UPI003BF7763D